MFTTARLVRVLMKKHSQWSDSGRDEDKSIPAPSVQQVSFVFLKKKKKKKVLHVGLKKVGIHQFLLNGTEL